jgi:HD superfamily phosphodiesterase
MENLLNFYLKSIERVKLLFEQEVDSRFEYHNLRHTLDVLEQAESIGRAEGVNDSDILLLKIAALFHDTGFASTRKNHEEASVQNFLHEAKGESLSEHEKQIICACILATCMPQNPKSPLERILCDADLDYLGREDFFEIGDKLYNEMLYAGEINPNDAWNELQIRFLENHQYKTDYSKSSRKKGLEENIQLLKQGLRHSR